MQKTIVKTKSRRPPEPKHQSPPLLKKSNIFCVLSLSPTIATASSVAFEEKLLVVVVEGVAVAVDVVAVVVVIVVAVVVAAVVVVVVVNLLSSFLPLLISLSLPIVKCGVEFVLCHTFKQA
jgi:hypothetical protein